MTQSDPTGGGSVACTPANPLSAGSDARCTATPAAGYALLNFTGCPSASGNACTFSNVRADAVLTANFVPTYPVTATQPTNGSLTCAPNPVAQGGTVTCEAKPDTGYAVASFSGCTRVGTGDTCTINNVTAARAVSVTFSALAYPITATQPTNGSLTCSPNPVAHGGTVTCEAQPDTGYVVASFSGCTRVGTGDTCTIDNVTAPQAVSVAFSALTYPVTATQPANGSLTCSPNPVAHGGTVTCEARPDMGYAVASFTGCTRVGTGDTCTISNVRAAQAVSATFSVLAPVPTLHTALLALLGLGAAALGAAGLRRREA